MTETSLFWDGTTVGDASSAPYDDTAIADVFDDVLGSFVIAYSNTPGDELLVGNSGTTGAVAILAGAAFVKGILYELDANTTLTIASNASGNPRIDRIVLQRDTVTQTVRVAVSQGTPGATPAIPTLDSANELSLAWLWVADGYDSGVDNIAAEEIHDDRIFRETGPSHFMSARKNLIQNSEFFGLVASAAATAIAKWKISNSPSLSVNTGTWRGYLIQMTGASNTQSVETTVTCNQQFTDSPLFTLEGHLFCTAGVVSLSIYRVDLSTGTSTLERTKYFRPGSILNTERFIIRERFDTELDAIRIVVKTESAAANDTVRFGEFNLSHGYMPTISYNHEIVWLDEPMTDASWSTTAKSTGSTTINLASSFGSILKQGVRGVIVRVRCRDSASAAATGAFDTALTFHHANQSTPSDLRAVAVVSCAGRANDTWEEQVIYVPIDQSSANVPFKVYAYASGAGTLDATLGVVGVIT